MDDNFLEIIEFEDFSPIDDIDIFPTSKCGHIAFTFRNKIWIWGGYTMNNEVMNEIYINPKYFWNYNLLTEKWQIITTIGSFPSPLSGASCSLISDRNLLFIFGGFYNDSMNSIFVCDLVDFIWSKENPQDSTVPSCRDKHNMWTYQNKFYIFGGYGPNINDFTNTFGKFLIDETSVRAYGWNNQVFSYDIDIHIWQNIQTTGHVPSPRAAHASDLLYDMLYLFGGRTGDNRLNDLYSLSLQHMIWTKIDIEGPIPDYRSWHTFTNVLNCSNIFVLYGGFNNDNKTHDDCWLFNVNTTSWCQFINNKFLPRLWHSCCCTSEGEVVFFGGCINDIFSNQPIYTNQIDVINISPKSLLRLCFKEIYKHAHILNYQFHQLPKDLRKQYLISIDCSDIDNILNKNLIISL